MKKEEHSGDLVKGRQPSLPADQTPAGHSPAAQIDEQPAGMSFLDHLEELRRRLLWCIVTLLVTTVAGFVITQQGGVIHFLTRPVLPYLASEKLTFLSPTEPIIITFKVAFFVGLIIALPVLFYHFWAFLAPGLLQNEKRVLFPAIFFSVLLFCVGVGMAFFLVLPYGLKFLLSFQAESLIPMITIREYLKFATNMGLVFGTIFELPLVIVVLTKIGVVTPMMLRTRRRYAIVVILILSAVLTPADVLTMMMMCLPLILLFEVSIWLSAMIYRRNESEYAG